VASAVIAAATATFLAHPPSLAFGLALAVGALGLFSLNLVSLCLFLAWTLVV